MVVIASPSCITARVRQELTRRPLMWTVHAPHWPWSQPFLVPVRSRCSRSASSRVVQGAMSSDRAWPLMFMETEILAGAGTACPPLAPAVLARAIGELRRRGRRTDVRLVLRDEPA